MDYRKKVKIEIELTHKQLCGFEDDWMCIPLCNKHKGINVKKSERELATMYYECKDCDKIREQWHRSAGIIFWKCWDAYWNKVKEVEKVNKKPS